MGTIVLILKGDLVAGVMPLTQYCNEALGNTQHKRGVRVRGVKQGALQAKYMCNCVDTLKSCDSRDCGPSPALLSSAWRHPAQALYYAGVDQGKEISTV
jgi:hypothetical protein